MRVSVLLPAALAMLMAAPTLAKSDNAKASAPGQTKGTGWSGGDAGKAKAKEKKPGSGGTPIAPGASSEQNDALDAVESGEALPLSNITAMALAQWGGKVIDAKLLVIKGQRIYRLTLLSADGVSRQVYYSARTGQPVQIH